MKKSRFMAGLLLVVLCILLVGCYSDADRPFTPPNDTVQVMTNIYDNGHNTIYITVNNPQVGYSNDSILDIMQQKDRWEKAFPSKKIVTFSVVNGSCNEYPCVIGLLLQYEESQQ